MLDLGSIFKYIIEGFAVAIATYLVSTKTPTLASLVILGFTAGVTFMILDLFTSGIGNSVRQGAGFGLGLQQVRFLPEGFEDSQLKEQPHGYLGSDLEKQTYGYVEKEENSEAPVQKQDTLPYRFPNVSQTTCPQVPTSAYPRTTQYGLTSSKSRWMGWVENGKPTNANTQDYKIVPGLYAQSIVQPGYNEEIRTYNGQQIAKLSPIDESKKKQ